MPNVMTEQGGNWFLADTARVLGDVRVGRGVSFWFGSVARGDVAPIIVGHGTNVQDNAVIHCDAGIPNTIGDNVTIGHSAVVHGASVGDGSLIGMSATLLGRSVVGVECLVAAGAVVPPGMSVPDRTLVAGVPARLVRELDDEDLAYLRRLPPHYTRMAARYAAGDVPGNKPRPLESVR